MNIEITIKKDNVLDTSMKKFHKYVDKIINEELLDIFAIYGYYTIFFKLNNHHGSTLILNNTNFFPT